MTMFMTLHRDWEALDASDPNNLQKTIIPEGRHEVELIPYPGVKKFQCNWIVLKNSKIGASEKSWRQWECYLDEFKVIIENME